ncbi:hypothetical protein [Acrocarpospora sp. B8E8]|uniref:hypothetical protein n=1 Tax=Acrocarpospora sp. B8E8 TaxID=3153572 RepID=UPI00325F4871
MMDDRLAAERDDRLSPRLRSLHRTPSAHLPRIVAEIETYWRLAMAPYWDRIRSVLEADIFHRGRQMAERGTAQVLQELHHTVRWDGGSLQLVQRYCDITRSGLSAAGVSQHLTALRMAGLTSAHRVGRSVLYARTGLADALLTAHT